MGCGSSVNDATEPASPQDKYSVEESEKQSAAGGKATQGKEDVPATKKPSGVPMITTTTFEPPKSPGSSATSPLNLPKTARGSTIHAKPADLKSGEEITVDYTITGGRTSDGDWIGLFKGNCRAVDKELPWWDSAKQPELGTLVCHFMASGMPSGTRQVVAPQDAGEYHFRYFFRDREDEAAAISNTLNVEKARASNARDKYLAGPSDFPVTQMLMVQSGFSMWYANVSECGFYPEEPSIQCNQDRFFAHTNLDQNQDQHLFGVVDGHGPAGSQCAQYVQAHLPKHLLQSAHYNDDPERALHSAFRAVNLEMRRSNQVDDTFSGAVAVVVLSRGHHVWIANCGDSRSILARSAKDEDGDVSLKAYDLSNDQTPFRADECARVKGLGAQVLSFGELELGVTNSEPYTADDPPLLFVPNCLYPGVPFTRSIGDMLAERIGVSATPEVMELQLGSDDRFIALASNGVCEMLSSQGIVDIVSRCFTPLDACNQVIAEAKRLWLAHDVRTADLTMVVVFMNGLESLNSAKVDLRASVDMYSIKPDALPTELSESSRPAGARSSIKREPAQLSYKSATQLFLEGGAHEEAQNQVAEKLDGDSEKSLCHSLRGCFLFSNLSQEQLQRVVSFTETLPVSKDGVVFNQGDAADYLYIIKEGVFDVFHEDATTSAPELVHTYKSSWGTHATFGELALMFNKPRLAMVRARTDGVLWRIHNHAYRRVHLEAHKYLAGLDTDDGYCVQTALPPKEDDELARLELAARHSQLFVGLSKRQRSSVFRVMQRRNVEPGEIIFNQGDNDNIFYVVDSGEFHVKLTVEGSEEMELVHTYKGGSFLKSCSSFGELGLMYGKPRGCTVMAHTNGVLWTLHRKAYHHGLKSAGQ